MATIKFGTKAETLQRLSGRLKKAKVLDLILITADNWRADNQNILNKLSEEHRGLRVIVRSSSTEEDTYEQSLAGHFVSVPNVDSSNKDDLKKAIDTVFDSYGDVGLRGDSQVFVQEQLQNITLSGVAFTKDIDSKSDYYIINYDSTLGSFDTVTSGSTNDTKTFICHKNSYDHILESEDPIHKTIEAARELENTFDTGSLDIEFAIIDNEQVYVLQVRPLLAQKRGNLFNYHSSETLLKIRKKLEKLSLPHPNLYGEYGMFGVMPDWNPAEIIGVRPKMLALSLYRELITDSIWAYQRHNYGYKDLRGFPLMISPMGIPYIDVRVSFNSFIPAELNDDISHKLANYYLDQLKANPSNHDKVEFNVVYSCFYFDLPKRLMTLKNHGFSENEIAQLKEGLLSITNRILDPDLGLMLKDLERVSKLENRCSEVLSSDMYLTDKIYWLVEECKRYGTLPFAGLARGGFVAMQMLRSMVREEVISQEEMDSFMVSLETVAKKLSLDLHAFRTSEKTKEWFIEKYGHLRPGTYDICSPNYQHGFDDYFQKQDAIIESQEKESASFELTAEKLTKIEDFLSKENIKCSAHELLDFFKKAIEGREYTKFVFTKCLNDIIELVASLGEKYSFSREELSHLNIRKILEMYSHVSSEYIGEMFYEDIQKNRRLHNLALSIKLPKLISQPNDVYAFHLDEEEPNFITFKTSSGDIVEEGHFNGQSLEDKVVFIKSADPGYDWIFSHNIKALVTMYGGANSHMAIRSAELDLPAIIGAGEKLFNSWKQYGSIEIDCMNKQVRRLP